MSRTMIQIEWNDSIQVTHSKTMAEHPHEMSQLYKQGAEARLFLETYLGKPAIVKERFPKRYRHPDLDNALTKERLRAESRAIVKCKQLGVRSPCLYLVDFQRRRIYMEYITDSITAKDFINEHEANNEHEPIDRVSEKIGEDLGRLHAGEMIHGDLTTSNILLIDESPVFIDFGLAKLNSTALDKAVDLYNLERALQSTHVSNEIIFNAILKGYGVFKGSKEVLRKLEEVRMRGRKRTMIG